ncbi:arsenate reductase (glutaredoxin) [Cytophagaceae bacterium ABcell3]|nr:arsenate reductase (glutaredoxin) [Cytophagaceae bacterium ABcell3]
MAKIYHNPRCRKSREALAFLKEQNIEPEIVEYLKTPPTKEELSEVINKLGIKAEDLIRKKEAVYKENFKGQSLSDEEWIEAMAQNPVLIERPIVIKGDKAYIARSQEALEQIK